MTFLFTDVEGSTRRWEENADGMRAALAAHDAVLRAAVEAHGGHVFKHTGDGVCAAFESAHSAVDAAVAAQHGLELPVRMGLATGEAEQRDGDYFGTVLNRAARLMAAGHGGQILLAESTAALLTGVGLIELGSRRLRDIPKPLVLYQVRAPGLPTEFPPIRTMSSHQGNLQAPTTSFIGRESEFVEVQAAMRTHRLVTLTGMGGVGKTRLALELATRMEADFQDGVWFLELAQVTDPSAIPDAVAAVLGVSQQPGSTVSELVAAAMEDKVALLVFDNCEHVLDAAADLIEAVVAKSATVRILATSREGMGVADEQVWPVGSLDIHAAVKLFAERAQSVSPRFSPTDDPERMVEICGRLDGIPLAIELAASRVASMAVSEVCDRLDQRFRLLVGSRRATGRHQTLRHAVAWSYDLLADDEKSLLIKCSVFAGGFDLESACAVAGSGGTDEYLTLDLLDALVRKSLLVADPSSGRTRFSMLETIREFADERLGASGDIAEIRTAHARHFAERGTRVLAVWESYRQQETYNWFSAEIANLRTAFRWAADEHDLESAAALAVCCAFLGIWVAQYEPVLWAEELIEPAGRAGHRRLGQLNVIAAQCYAAGRVDDAVRYVDASRQLVHLEGFDEAPFDTLCSAGIVYSAAGQPERWVDLCRSEIATTRGPLPVQQACLVMALNQSGREEEALTASEGLLATAETTDTPSTACFALLAHGIAHIAADPIAAYDSLSRAVTIAQESGNRQLEVAAAVTQSILMAADGGPMGSATPADPADALDFLAVTIRRYHEAGSVSLLRYPLAILTAVLDRLGHHEQAATISGFAATPMTHAAYQQIDVAVAHLRDVLGDQTYESLALDGERMSAAAVVAYALEQIDCALMR